MARTLSPGHAPYGPWMPFRKKITYAIENTVIDIARFPAYSFVLTGGVHILTAFNDSGTDTLDVGFRDGSATDDPNGIATALAIDAVGYIVFDELAATTNIIQTKPWILTCTYNGQNNNATAGVAYIAGLVSVGPTDGS